MSDIKKFNMKSYNRMGSIAPSLSLFSLIFLSVSGALSQTPTGISEIRADAKRMETRIRELARFGRDEKGGTSRVAFSEADRAGREYVIGLMKRAGLAVSIDFAGNIVGKRKGRSPSRKPILFGSHIDTVPNGGNYDGCVGSIGALEAIELLNENNIVTEHPLEVIVFSDEEGGLTGSRALIGTLGATALKVKSHSGRTIGEGIRFIGGDPDRLVQIERSKGDVAAFLELHIEQGGTLEREKTDIGVVEGIVGIEWWEITIEGFANHAGTTPMKGRRDAVVAGSRLALAVNEIVNSFKGAQVGTVGRFVAEPGAPNVIPGKVTMSLELRDLSSEKIMSMYRKIRSRAEQIAKETDTAISFRHLDVSAVPAITDKRIKSLIEESAIDLGLTFRRMPSGAGHDAQDMAKIAPTGMIFVPSRGGISHSPKEFTSARDMANGASVLFRTILAIDKQGSQ